jgi:hypothetical protein
MTEFGEIEAVKCTARYKKSLTEFLETLPEQTWHGCFYKRSIEKPVNVIIFIQQDGEWEGEVQTCDENKLYYKSPAKLASSYCSSGNGAVYPHTKGADGRTLKELITTSA